MDLWFKPLPRARIAWLRVSVYAFIFVDVFLLRPWVSDNGMLPPDLYHPLMIGRILPLPTPTPLVVSVVKYGLLISAAVAASGRFVRLSGSLAFALYLEWMLIAFSYGKVDHDRFAILVALAVLPTVGKASWKDRFADEASGWAITSIQVAVVLTYFLAVFAKLRFGGIDWVNGATLMRAVLRRGNVVGESLESLPWLLHVGQYLILAFELTSPLMLWAGRVQRVYLGMALGFHIVTFTTIGIMFWPHVLCLLAFVPLERLGGFLHRRSRPSSPPGGLRRQGTEVAAVPGGGT